MKTFSAIYRGNRTVELFEDVDFARNTRVWVLVSEPDDETEMRVQLGKAAERVLTKLWDNPGDEIWHEYL